MRHLIVSDIHGNWEALEAVLTAADGAYDQIVCCGDLVGYGADPNRVVEWTRQHSLVTVRGNHDKVAAGLDTTEDFNPLARRAAHWTVAALEPTNTVWLKELPEGPLAIEDFQIVHGSPRDEDEYVVEVSEARDCLCGVDHRLTFFGHTHVQGGFSLQGTRLIAIGPPFPDETEYTFSLQPDTWYMVNAGSVGQPRDGDWRAAYAIYDSAQRLVSLHRTPYDLSTAQQKIRDAGLPPMLADRLARGV